MLLTVDPDGTERVLIDPMAIDPSGTTTLDAWQPSKEGDRLAYQLSEGGSEDSVLRVMDVATGEIVDGPIDRARYSPVAWLVGGQAYYYVRRLDPAGLPEGEEMFHRRVWLHQVGTDPDQDVLVFGDGLDPMNYYGVHLSWDGRWLSVGLQLGHRAAHRRLPGRPLGLRTRAAGVRRGAERRRCPHLARSSAATAGPTSRPTATHLEAGWPSWTRPTRPTRAGST